MKKLLIFSILILLATQSLVSAGYPKVILLKRYLLEQGYTNYNELVGGSFEDPYVMTTWPDAIPIPKRAALVPLYPTWDLVLNYPARHLENIGGVWQVKGTNDIAIADEAYYTALSEAEADFSLWNVEDASTIRLLIDEINVLRAEASPPLPPLTETGVVAKISGKIKDEHDNGNHGSNNKNK